jgi:hypothetical protein
MNASAAEVVLEWLISKNHATRYNAQKQWPIWLGQMPTEPDNTLTVYDTMGVKDGRLMPTGTTLIHPGIQVRCRNSDYNLGWNKLEEIRVAFDNVKGDTVTLRSRTYKLQNISMPTGVIPLGQELGKVRQLFTLNALVTISDITA